MICKNCNRTIEYTDSYKKWFHIQDGLDYCLRPEGCKAEPTKLTEAEKLYQNTPLNVENQVRPTLDDLIKENSVDSGPRVWPIGKLGPIPPVNPELEKALKGAISKITTTNPKDLLGEKKVSLGAVLPIGMVHEGMAMMDGDFKYGWRNFREKKVQARIYIDAALRHIEAWAEGEELAEDSGVHHLGHAKACLGILLDAQENGNLIDNRAAGSFNKALKRMETWVANRVKKHNETGK